MPVVYAFERVIVPSKQRLIEGWVALYKKISLQNYKWDNGRRFDYLMSYTTAFQVRFAVKGRAIMDLLWQ